MPCVQDSSRPRSRPDRAAEHLWPRIDAPATTDAYEMFGALRFLQYAPDRARAVRSGASSAPAG
ncbi:MAG: hypothetical protein WCB85_14735 [Candidatus Dormiibacterota bacterium]